MKKILAILCYIMVSCAEVYFTYMSEHSIPIGGDIFTWQTIAAVAILLLSFLFGPGMVTCAGLGLIIGLII